MAKTLLAVDDSVTMRKVLEITFSGEDFTVIAADTSQGAIAKMSENPAVVVIDTVLGGEDGYALAKELRKRSPGTAIVLLASRYAPYDQARGKDAGADDWADKPFDTQALIDKVKKVVLAKEAGGAAAAAPAPAAPTAGTASGAYRPAPPPPSGGATLGRTTQASLGGSLPNRSPGVAEGLGGPTPGPLPPRPAPLPAPTPIAAPAPTAAAAPPSPAAAPVAAAVNGHLSGKLGELGLSAQQAEAVLALSRELVERVVWEVVPQLAEAIIKEEIARLTKE